MEPIFSLYCSCHSRNSLEFDSESPWWPSATPGHLKNPLMAPPHGPPVAPHPPVTENYSHQRLHILQFFFFYFFHPPAALFLGASFSPRFPLWLIRRTSKNKKKQKKNKKRNEAKKKRIFCRRNICFCECVRLTLKIKSMSEHVKPSNTQ